MEVGLQLEFNFRNTCINMCCVAFPEPVRAQVDAIRDLSLALQATAKDLTRTAESSLLDCFSRCNVRSAQLLDICNMFVCI